MKGSRVRASLTFALILPTAWWLAEVIPPRFYDGWNHDPRFYRIYLPTALLLRPITDQSGWIFQGYVIALQDMLVALLVTVPAALVLNRHRTWQESTRLRLLTALASLGLPWFGVVRPWEDPEPYQGAVVMLCIAYVASIIAAVTARVSAEMRRSLLGIALASGATLTVWRLDRWQWLYAGSLVASLLLLAYGTVRGGFTEGQAA
jgi:hypothetical protein